MSQAHTLAAIRPDAAETYRAYLMTQDSLTVEVVTDEDAMVQVLKNPDSPVDILIIDNEEVVLDSCTQILAKGNFDLVTASNGTLGLEKVKEFQPYLIFVDLNPISKIVPIVLSSRITTSPTATDLSRINEIPPKIFPKDF